MKYSGPGLAAQVIRSLELEDHPLFNDGGAGGFLAGVWRGAKSLFGTVSTGAAVTPRIAALGVRPDIIDAYLKRLSITPRPDTRLVAVEFSTPDPSLSARIVNAHVQTYIRQGMELHAQAGREAQHFLEDKLIDLRERVEKSEAALNASRALCARYRIPLAGGGESLRRIGIQETRQRAREGASRPCAARRTQGRTRESRGNPPPHPLSIKLAPAATTASRGIKPVRFVLLKEIDERGFVFFTELEERYARSEPLKRLGEPEEIGEAVAWLCSERASYVTGLPMPVDGGFMAQ
jgi:Enoyl-(Acyl carrier protein) reductase